MPSLILPTLSGIDRDVEVAIKRLRDQHGRLTDTLDALGVPTPDLTLDEIRSALQATGTHPLTLAGLTGIVPPGDPPTVTLTAEGSLTAPTALTLIADPKSPTGTITRVTFYQDGAFRAALGNAPWRWVNSGVGTGTYQFVAFATDNSGRTVASNVLPVTVAPPASTLTVEITSPADGTQYQAPATVTIQTRVHDPSHPISRVEFYESGHLIGTAASAPYAHTASGLAESTYTFTARAYNTALQHADSSPVTITVGHAGIPPRGWEPPQYGTGRLHVSGKVIVDDAHTIWPWYGATDFLLYKRYLDGEDISALLADRAALGVNLLRVLGMAQTIAAFHPQDYPGYYSTLPGFCSLLLAHGFQLELTVFADAQSVIGGNLGLLRSHFQRVVDALHGVPNVFLELVNEWTQNGITPTDFVRPSGIISSRGSGIAGDYPPTPPWDYCTYHVPRDGEWPRKASHIREIRDDGGYNRPVVQDEPMGAGETDQPNRRSTVANDFFYFGATSQMMGAGSTFHSDCGILSTLLTPTQHACGVAQLSGARAIPPETQLWAYTRGGLANNPIVHSDALSLRTYSKYTESSAVCVVIRPQPGWSAIAQNGWTITRQEGPMGCVVFLSR